MALIDARTGAVVIRVVYDGAPMSGKTTSLRMLGASLGVTVTTPQEVAGRTLYFDWLDYTGGLFEGRRIRCQLVSVPGQTTLAPRRRRLLEGADAVVFVGDSSPDGFEADRSYLRGLYGVLAGLGDPRVGIVFQANKRDRPDAVPLAALRTMLAEVGRIGLVEAVATAGTGIREAFVFAVRLALDRVRELSRSGQLPTAAPAIDGPHDLLAEVRRIEQGALDHAADSDLADIRLAELRKNPSRTEVSVTGPPALPNEHVQSGMIWPPVDGRLILQELATTTVSLRQLSCGSWSGTADGGWTVHSEVRAVFEQIEQGRELLIQLARQCAAAPDLSVERLVVLAEDGQRRYRLWQITRQRPLRHSQIGALSILNNSADEC